MLHEESYIPEASNYYLRGGDCHTRSWAGGDANYFVEICFDVAAEKELVQLCHLPDNMEM